VNGGAGESGGQIEIAVSLFTAGLDVARVEQDLLFDDSVLQILEPATDCQINPALGAAQPGCIGEPQVGPCKTLQRNLADCPGAAGCPQGFTGKRLHIGVVSIYNRNPIPDGTLYRCRFTASAGVSGTTSVDSRNEQAYDPNNSDLPTDGINGLVTVFAPATVTPTMEEPSPTPGGSNCCTDRSQEGLAGCDDAVCEACVCNVPPEGSFCCEQLWDALCADIAGVECEAECGCSL